MEKKSYTRKQIAQRIIENEDLLIIYSNKIYRLNSWIKHHPGGDMVILHMIGKDATDEINAYHSDHVLRTKLPLFYFGDVENENNEEYSSLNPPIQCDYRNNDLNNNRILTSETLLTVNNQNMISNANEHKHIIQAYRQLAYKLRFLGLFQCNYFDYGRECLRYFFFAFMSFYFFYQATKSWHYYLSAVFLGVFWHQLTFTAHDAGHLAITHSYRIDSYIGIFIANFLGGVSIGWWKYHHNIHHIVTNSPEHDPDIQHLPFFAVTPRFFKSLYSTYHKRILSYTWLASCIIQFQHFTYYLIMCFARVNLQIQSYIYLYKRTNSPYRYVEIFFIGLYWSWFIYLLSLIPTYTQCLIYLFICYVVTMPLHVQITLSHFGMSTEDYGPCESFPAKMLRTTMDIACPTWLDFFHGGLQYQAVHHLFPRMPRHQLRKASDFVRQFADEVGLTYHMYGFVHGNIKVLNVLKDVAMQIKLMRDVAMTTNIYHHH
jgi:delta8-fatty-acid desaturase